MFEKATTPVIRPKNVAVLRSQEYILKCRLEGEVWRYPTRNWYGPGAKIIDDDGRIKQPEKFSFLTNSSSDRNLMVKNAQHGTRYSIQTRYPSQYVFTFMIVYSK